MVKKILIVSDSHSKSDNVKIAIDRENPDMLIHLGDIEDDPEKLRGWLDDAAKQYNSKLDSGKSSAEEISLPVPAVFIKGNCDTYGSRDLKKKAVAVIFYVGKECSDDDVTIRTLGMGEFRFTDIRHQRPSGASGKDRPS